jgi:hypothetical protein
MRKTAITLLLMTVAAGAYAQNAYDALNFSENNYEGSARTVAMGNAFTALGGDLGAVTINPAGSAVAGYSQFAITPGLTFSTSTAQGVSPYDDGELPYFQKAMKSRMSRFSIPNFGLTFNWDTGRKSGLKSFTFGFVLTKTASWDEDIYATGTNSTTSFMGQLAAEATDQYMWADQLSLQTNPYAYDDCPWKYVLGYNSNMIAPYGGDNDGDFFVGASELIFDNGEIALGGPLEQTYGRRVTGGKYDYVFNLGANISDYLFLGMNLGINTLEYNYDEYFKEVAVNPSDFEISFEDGTSMCFEKMRYNNGYSASGTGYFAKFGFIITPIAGLRIGGAIQTPTVTTIEEKWGMSGFTEFTGNSASQTEYTPEGEFRYKLRSPMRANIGAAYTFGSFGVISADYEICNYGGMRFDGSSYDRDYFAEINQDIQNRFGAAHSFRLGLEVKPSSSVAIRAGYNVNGCAEKTNSWGEKIDPVYTQNASFGLGFSSKGSFFADIAARRTFLADELFMPYADYIYDADGYVTAPTPEIRNHKSLWKMLLTVGWRF